MAPSTNEMQRAFSRSDVAYDGIFWTAVKTTGIFCKPSCRAKKPRPENVEFFFSPKEAMFAGYRACKRCRPLAQPGEREPWVATLIALAEDTSTKVTARHLLQEGIDPTRARRYFQRTAGVTFAEYARSRRLAEGLRAIAEGSSLDDAAYETGFESLSGFRSAFGQKFGAPPGRGRTLSRLVSRIVETPLGRMVAAASDAGLCMLEFSDRKMLPRQIKIIEHRFGGALVPGDSPHLDAVETQLAEYFDGTRTRFEIALATPGSAFQERVWTALRAIPYGELRSYTEIARAIDSPRAVRAVGAANGMNRISIVIPCHRVVQEGGKLGGYGGGYWRKQFLLEHEQTHLR